MRAEKPTNGAFQNQEKTEKKNTVYSPFDQGKKGGFQNQTLIKSTNFPKKTVYFPKEQKKK
jgi:hypothetical protein